LGLRLKIFASFVIFVVFVPPAAGTAWAQAARGAAATPGITIQPGPSMPVAPAQRPNIQPPGGNWSSSHPVPFHPTIGGIVDPFAAKPGPVDRFRAKPGTFDPRFQKHFGFSPFPAFLSPYPYYPFPYLASSFPPIGVTDAGLPYATTPLETAGYLRLDVYPRRAQVFVDGFFIGTIDDIGAGGYALTPGPHRVELRADGFESVTFDISVRPNDTIRFTRDLRRLPVVAPEGTQLAPAIAPVRKTLYVIPRCYAGDRRPAASELPASCDIAALRVIPVAAQ
jgi:hypothetical protein